MYVRRFQYCHSIEIPIYITVLWTSGVALLFLCLMYVQCARVRQEPAYATSSTRMGHLCPL
jgi:hypothetical protein